MEFQPFPVVPASQEAQALVQRLAEANRDKMCAGLIDQDRAIGGDPVGHACDRWATGIYWIGSDGLGWPVCDSCRAALKAGDGRVTLPLWRAVAGRDA